MDEPQETMLAVGVAQEVECLPSNLRLLSSNPNTAKKKEKMLSERSHIQRIMYIPDASIYIKCPEKAK
jgi:hypothetical protein